MWTKEKDSSWKSYELARKYYEQKQTLGELTAGKCKAKTAFTKTRHELIRLIEQGFPTHKDVRNIQLRLYECQEKAISVIVKLGNEYKKSEYNQCWKNTQRETEKIKEEFEEAHQMAEKYLERLQNGASLLSSDIPILGMGGLVREDECVEMRINDGRVQNLDSFDFSKLSTDDWTIKDGQRQSYDPYNFDQIPQKNWIKDGRRQNFDPSTFSQSTREKGLAERQRQCLDHSTFADIEDEKRMKDGGRRQTPDSSIHAQCVRDKRIKERRKQNWGSSSTFEQSEEEKRKLSGRKQRPTFEQMKQDNWMTDRRRKYSDQHDGHYHHTTHSGKENMLKDYRTEQNTLFKVTTPKRGIRKHVSFGGFDYKDDNRQPKVIHKRNVTSSHDNIADSLISVVEHTKTFNNYNKIRAKLLEMLDYPMPRKNKVKEMQELMRAYYNKVQDEIVLLSEEFKHDIKKQESEMLSAFNMAGMYLESCGDDDEVSESSMSIGDFSLKDLPHKFKKAQRRPLTEDDLLVKVNLRL